ncbi:MAG: 50S ribosomal protein L15 [Albidovulum sp.]|nr:50S ribosomal protein L15 [Albidovulum sp.]
MKLNELSDKAGSSRNRKRVGRGPGSGTGKTAGRGMKGQKSRSGVSLKGFEGGQMPLYQRMPKRGFRNPGRKSFGLVNLGILQKFIDAGKIDPESPVTEKELVESGAARSAPDGVRVLGKGELRAKINLVVAGASKPAIAAVEALGGTIETRKAN